MSGPQHTGILVHYGSETEWEMNRALCSSEILFFFFCIFGFWLFALYAVLFIWCSLPFGLFLCCHISFSVSVFLCLAPAFTPSSHLSQWEGSSVSPINTNEQESPPEEGLSAAHWCCYSAIPLHFLTRSIELNLWVCKVSWGNISVKWIWI